MKIENAMMIGSFRIWTVIGVIVLMMSLDSTAQSGEFDVVSYDEFRESYLQPSDQPVIFNFWATWCKPCVKEMPHFIEMAEKHPEWKLVLVSLDFPRHFESRLRPFLIENQIMDQVVVLDEANANVYIDNIDPSWSGSIPATLIWKDKKMGFIEDEFDSYTDLKNYILKSLKTR